MVEALVLHPTLAAGWRDLSEAPDLRYYRSGRGDRVHCLPGQPLPQDLVDQPAGTRQQGEIKRRTDVVGIFPNEARRVVLLEIHDEWAIAE